MMWLYHFSFSVKLLAPCIFIILTKHIAHGWVISTRSTWATSKSPIMGTQIGNHRRSMLPALNMAYREWQFPCDKDRELFFEISTSDGNLEEFSGHILTESSRGEESELVVVDDDELDKQRWQRLARFLVQESEGNLVGMNIAIIGSSWIGFLAAQLGAAKVNIYDEEYKESNYQSHINIYKMESKNYPCDFCNERRQIQFLDTLEMESFDAEVILLSTSSPDLINDPFVNEVLRRTDAPILWTVN